MSTYSDEAVAQLHNQVGEIPQKALNLKLFIFNAPTKSDEARVVLHQGVLRRVNLVAHAIQRIFCILPPETSKIPTKETLDEATLHIHAHIFNTYGILDCWAHVWVRERDVRKKNNDPLPNNRIGLGRKYLEVQNSLPAKLSKKIDELSDWFVQFSHLRHALAHQIPPYIPPHMVDPKNEEKYNQLNFEWNTTLQSQARSDLEAEMERLSHFKAYLVYELEKAPPLLFHSQLICDFLTIEDLSNAFVRELYETQKAG